MHLAREDLTALETFLGDLTTVPQQEERTNVCMLELNPVFWIPSTRPPFGPLFHAFSSPFRWVGVLRVPR